MCWSLTLMLDHMSVSTPRWRSRDPVRTRTHAAQHGSSYMVNGYLMMTSRLTNERSAVSVVANSVQQPIKILHMCLCLLTVTDRPLSCWWYNSPLFSELCSPGRTSGLVLPVSWPSDSCHPVRKHPEYSNTETSLVSLVSMETLNTEPLSLSLSLSLMSTLREHIVKLTS